MHYALLLFSLLTISIVSSPVNASKSGGKLSLLEAHIGKQRDATISIVEKQWGAKADCNTMRTGVGTTRRAYFLETCVLHNALGKTLYDEAPDSAIYQFLEGQLVQVSYEFTQILEPVTFRRCVQSAAKKLEAKYADTDDPDKRRITMAGDFLVSISAVHWVEKIHALRDTP